MEKSHKKFKEEGEESMSSGDSTEALSPCILEALEQDLLGKGEIPTGSDAPPQEAEKVKGIIPTESGGKKGVVIPRMCGSGRKRFQWLLKHGYTTEEALEKYKDPIGTHPDKTEGTGKGSKRPLANVSGAEERSPSILKKTKLSTSQRTEGSGRGKDSQMAPPPKSYKNVVEGVKVGILPESYPQIKFSKEQFKLLEDEILGWILRIKTKGFGPQFLNSSYKDGWLMLNCANQETAEWVIRIAPKLKPWEDAMLRGVKGNDLPKRKTLVAFLPNAKDLDLDVVVESIRIQNPQLEVDKWQAGKRTELPGCTQLTFAIDDASAERLMGDGATLYFKFGRVRFHIFKDRAGEVDGGVVAEGKENPKTSGVNEEKSEGIMEVGDEEAHPTPKALSAPSTSTPYAKEHRGKKEGKPMRPPGTSPLKVLKDGH